MVYLPFLCSYLYYLFCHFLFVLNPYLPVAFRAVGVAAVVVFLLIIVCFLAVEVSLLVSGFDEEDAGVAETFVAPVADLISTASVWQPTDTTCFATKTNL